MKYALGNMLNGAGGLNPDGLALDLQFAADKTLTARRGPTPVFTRASTGTFVGSNGLIQSAGNNVARFDHDPANPTVCRGLLIEESRTNLILQSENHPSASWNKTGVTVAPVTHTAPDGNTSSNLVSEDSSTGLHRLFQGSAYVSGTSYAISVFLKFAGRRFVAIVHPAIATNNIAIFDIQNGSVTLQESGITASMIQHPNGWWRCVVVGTSSTTSIQSHIIQGSTTGGFLTGSYTGLNGAAFYIYGSQVEAGSFATSYPFATSYIPTTTSTVIRSADVCSITGAAFNNFYNQLEGTLFAEYDRSTNQGAGVKFNWMVAAMYNATLPNTFSVLLSTHVSDGRTTYRNAGTDVYNNTPPLLSVNTSIKSSYGYKSGDFATSRGGALTGTGTGTIPAVSTFDRIEFGFSNLGTFGPTSGQYINGHIAAIKYFRKRLPNAKLQALTA